MNYFCLMSFLEFNSMLYELIKWNKLNSTVIVFSDFQDRRTTLFSPYCKEMRVKQYL